MNDTMLTEIKAIIRQQTEHPLKDFAVIYPQTVAWGDMDAFQHVNNVMYYNYAQNARIYYNTCLGLFDKDTASALVASSCHYIKSVTYPDTLWIGVRIKKVGNASVTHEYIYYSTAMQTIIAKGESVLVYLHKSTGDKKPIDADKKAAIRQLEKL